MCILVRGIKNLVAFIENDQEAYEGELKLAVNADTRCMDKSIITVLIPFQNNVTGKQYKDFILLNEFVLYILRFYAMSCISITKIWKRRLRLTMWMYEKNYSNTYLLFGSII